MLHPELIRVIRINYYHLLFFGLMATTLRFPTTTSFKIDRHISQVYLFYTGIITAVLLLEIPYLMPNNIFDGYMKYNLLLQKSFLITIILRVSSILGFYITVWRHRHDIINLYTDFYATWRTYRQMVKRLVGLESLDQLQQYLAKLVWRNLFVNYGVLLCSFVVQYQLLSSISNDSILMLLARFSQIMLVIAAKIGIYLMLSLLNHQFKAIQMSLKALSKQQPMPKVKDLRNIARMQKESYELASRSFRIYDVANATVFLNMFSSSVNIFYHAVQYSNKSIKSTGWGYLFGNSLVIFNIWNSFILMNMMDRAVSSCNDIGQLLRLFTELKVSKQFQIELDTFACRLRSQRLVYKIFSSIKLDKSACLSYIGTVLGYVIIMMQFDIREKTQITMKDSNLSNVNIKK